jgi:hypothetical protein
MTPEPAADLFGSDRPVELRLRYANRAAIVGSRSAAPLIATWIPERSVGEHDERVLRVAEIAVPATFSLK